MRQLFSRLGRIRTVILLTIIAVLLAIFLTLVFEFFLGRAGMQVYPLTAIFIAVEVATYQ